jgi:hypothetical protein
VTYELRFKTGEVHSLGRDPSLTDDQELALQSGAAQLVRIEAYGKRAVVVDVDDITEVSPRDSALQPAPVSAAESTIHNAGGPTEMDTPLLSIGASGADAFGAGQYFETLADFDAAVRAARAMPQNSELAVSCIITWKDETTFHGSLPLSADCDEYLVDHVIRICGDMVNDPDRRATAAVTLHRIFAAAMAESRVSTGAATSPEGVRSTSEVPTGGLEPAPRPGYRRSMSSKQPCYATEGALRGRCGHKHRDLESAVDCLDADEQRCVALGGHTDRRIVFMAPGVKRELNDDERAAMARYRAESRSE